METVLSKYQFAGACDICGSNPKRSLLLIRCLHATDASFNDRSSVYFTIPTGIEHTFHTSVLLPVLIIFVNKIRGGHRCKSLVFLQIECPILVIYASDSCFTILSKIVHYLRKCHHLNLLIPTVNLLSCSD